MVSGDHMSAGVIRKLLGEMKIHTLYLQNQKLHRNTNLYMIVKTWTMSSLHLGFISDSGGYVNFSIISPFHSYNIFDGGF